MLAQKEKKIEALDFKQKLNIQNFEEENILRFRKNCKNAKLRNIYFRLIHNDFFTYERMKRFKMTETDECPRCGNLETTKHLLYECNHSKNIWKLYNDLMTQTLNEHDKVNKYEDIFNSCEWPGTAMVKIRIIQELIQIERPKNWNAEKILNIVRDLMNVERYNAINNRNIKKFNDRWQSFKIDSNV